MPQHRHSDSWAKRVELSLRRVLVRALSASARGMPRRVEQAEMAIALPEQPRFLLLRQDKIGDVLVSMPVLRLLRGAYPQARIDVVLGKANVPVRHAVLHYANHVYQYQKQAGAAIALLRLLRRTKYDVVIDLMDKTSATSSVLIAATNAAYAIGLEKENAEVYTHSVVVPNRTTAHIVERTARVLLPLGIAPQPAELALEYPLSAEERVAAEAVLGAPCKARRVGVNVSGSSEERSWQVEKWVQCVEHLVQHYPDAEVVLFAAPHHTERQQLIANATGVRAVPVVPTFHAFAALIGTCTLLVTPDTSVVHLAAAFRIPSVVLFAHVDSAASWHPYRSPHVVVTSDSNQLSDIAVADVLAAVEHLWEQQ